MREQKRKGGRAATALKLGVVALTMVGALEIAFAQSSPRVVAAQTARTVTLYKSPTCTCCSKWGDHLRENGFEVREEVSQDVPALMEERGVPTHLRSCHLGVVGEYVLVGHVPAEIAVRLLEEEPVVTGIAVPGMPLGTPGMETFGRIDRYEVSAFGPGAQEYLFEGR